MTPSARSSALLLLLALLAPAALAQEARQESPAAVEPALPASYADAFHWRSIGPANMGGRIVDLAVVESDPSTYWVATASGGLLKTTNAGVTYEHQFDQESTVSIGDVTVAPSNPDIVWVGTGEANPRNSVSWGDGVYKSEDGGETWRNMGLRESFQIGRIVIHPEDPDIVYVGALGRLWGPNEERGLFKTTDGGETWEKVLYVDEDTGVIDLQMHPTDPDTLIAATYQRRRDGFDTNDPAVKWGEGSGLYKTSDGGLTFRRLSNGLPSGKLGRIGLDWYRADPNVVYAVVESDRITHEPENAAYLGVEGRDADVGARLTTVAEDGPAAEAGLEEGDIVVAVEGTTVHSYADLVKEIRRRLAGDTVQIEVSRDRESVVMEATFSRRPGSEEDESEEGPPVEASAPEEPGAIAAAEPHAEETASGAQSETVEGEAVAVAEASGEEGESVAATEASADAPAGEGEGEEGEEEEEEEAPEPGPFHSGLGGQRENVQDQQGPEGHEYGGVYRSSDAGETWVRVNSVNPRPMYFSQIRVDPSDETYQWVLGVSLYQSEDGGETYDDDGAGNGVHVDHHAMWINPQDGRHVILGNDGGVYVSFDRGKNWDHHNHLAIGQFYRVTADFERDYKVYGGLQDNGSWGGPSRVRTGGGPVNEDWIRVGGGDGFVCKVDADDPDLIYMESQNGAMGRYHLTTGERGSVRPRAPRGTRYRFNWNTPFILSSHNTKIHYSAGNYVFRSYNKGEGIQAISPEISRTDRGSATALSESPVDPGILYVGTDDGAVWMTQSGGHEWVDLRNLPEEEAAEAEQAEEARPRGPIAVEAAGERQEPADGGEGRAGGEARGAQGGGFLARMLENDANGDGKLQRSEAPERMSRFFDRVDANGDGVLESKELEAMQERRRQGGGGAGGGFGGGAFRGGSRTEATEPQEPADALSGTWHTKATDEDLPAGQGEFTIELKLAEDGTVTGSMSTAFGEGEISEASFDAETGKLSFRYSRDGMSSQITATVKDNTIRGEIVFGDGAWQMEFAGKRALGEEKEEDPDRVGHDWARLEELVPEPLWVSTLVASRFKDGRVYATFDGHRSDDDESYVLLSEDFGRSWRSLRADLPENAGSARTLAEDYENPNLLFLGTEFGAWASIDRGASWTSLNGTLPTVAVHEFALHEPSGEVVAATHGRSLWILDANPLRQMSAEALAEGAHLYQPAAAVIWRSEPGRGSSGTRRFVGDNPPAAASIYYSLAEAPDSIKLRVTDLAGETVRELEAGSEAGLHRVEWDLRRPRPDRGDEGRRRWRRRGPRVPAGTYMVVLEVDGTSYRKPLQVSLDPKYPDSLWVSYEDMELGAPFVVEEDEESGSEPQRRFD